MASRTDAQSAGRPRAGRRLTRTATSHRAADYIRELIFRGELGPRERIDQDQVAEDLGVSRLPVREAIISLESEGVVTNEPHRGAYVVPLYRADIEDHYAIYGRIQGIAAQRAATVISAEEVAELERLNADLVNLSDEERRRDLDWEFHSLINRIGGSQRLLSVLRQMGRLLPQGLYGLPPSMSARSVVQHAGIIDALRAGDPDAADRAAVEHTTVEGEHLVALLRERQILSEDPGEQDAPTSATRGRGD